MSDWCDVMEMARSGCAHCRPAEQQVRFARVEKELAGAQGHAPYDREVGRSNDFEVGPVTRARHPGTCPACKFDIVVGEQIVLARPGWIHQECAP